VDRNSDSTDSRASALQRLAALQRLREQAQGTESEELLKTIDHLIELDAKAVRGAKPGDARHTPDEKPES
jgi:hypothetical protein